MSELVLTITRKQLLALGGTIKTRGGILFDFFWGNIQLMFLLFMCKLNVLLLCEVSFLTFLEVVHLNASFKSVSNCSRPSIFSLAKSVSINLYKEQKGISDNIHQISYHIDTSKVTL